MLAFVWCSTLDGLEENSKSSTTMHGETSAHSSSESKLNNEVLKYKRRREEV